MLCLIYSSLSHWKLQNLWKFPHHTRLSHFEPRMTSKLVVMLSACRRLKAQQRNVRTDSSCKCDPESLVTDLNKRCVSKLELELQKHTVLWNTGSEWHFNKFVTKCVQLKQRSVIWRSLLGVLPKQRLQSETLLSLCQPRCSVTSCPLPGVGGAGRDRRGSVLRKVIRRHSVTTWIREERKAV